MHNILALDLGNNSAYAAIDRFGTTSWGHVVLDPNDGKPKKCLLRPARLGRYFNVLGDWIDGFEREHGCLDMVAYERPFARGQAATRSGWGYAGIIEAVVSNRQHAGILDVTPAEIKAFHHPGKPKASKEEMMDAARRLGYTGSNEHEADAFCLLTYVNQMKWEQ